MPNTKSHSNSVEYEPQPGRISFLLVDHSPANVAEITRQIAASEADVVLEERVGSTQETRDAVEAKINAGISANTLDERIEAVKGLSQELRDTVWALAGSGKKVHFVDVASDQPEYGLIAQARVARHLDPERYNEIFSRSIDARESVVARQIAEWQRRYAGQNLLVVLGAIHGRVAENFTGSEVAYMDPEVRARASQRLATIALGNK